MSKMYYALFLSFGAGGRTNSSCRTSSARPTSQCLVFLLPPAGVALFGYLRP